MSYRDELPRVFPYVIVVETKRAEKIIEFLIKSRGNIPCGSSFAVTSDTDSRNKRNLWLSKVSYESLSKELLSES